MKYYIRLFPYNGSQYLNNIAFDEKNNKGVEASVLVYLHHYLKKRGFILDTYDIPQVAPIQAYVYLDLPYPWDISAWKTILTNVGKNILFCNESSLIIPFNYWRILHIFFKKVYTWYEPYIDGRKYFRSWLPKSSVGLYTKPYPFNKKRLLVLINKNTKLFLPFILLNQFGKELYTLRIQAIEYFEKHLPHDFDLFGRGWNIPKKYSIFERLFGFKRYKSYKGEIDDKISQLSRYKFSICFENVGDVNGYITEKIFDCLKARCVPIYLGASDITKYIPKTCFIDYKDFMNFDTLLQFIVNMNEKTYNTYIRNIENILSDKNFQLQWFEEGFAKFFYENILNLKNEKAS